LLKWNKFKAGYATISKKGERCPSLSTSTIQPLTSYAWLSQKKRCKNIAFIIEGVQFTSTVVAGGKRRARGPSIFFKARSKGTQRLAATGVKWLKNQKLAT
jgi:hypothetical protein